MEYQTSVEGFPCPMVEQDYRIVVQRAAAPIRVAAESLMVDKSIGPSRRFGGASSGTLTSFGFPIADPTDCAFALGGTIARRIAGIVLDGRFLTTVRADEGNGPRLDGAGVGSDLDRLRLVLVIIQWRAPVQEDRTEDSKAPRRHQIMVVRRSRPQRRWPPAVDPLAYPSRS